MSLSCVDLELGRGEKRVANTAGDDDNFSGSDEDYYSDDEAGFEMATGPNARA